MSAHSELTGILLDVVDRLDRTATQAASAIPLLEQGKTALLALNAGGDGWHPVELDVALRQTRHAVELVTRATQAIRDYVSGL
jgi:hypothetical protein